MCLLFSPHWNTQTKRLTVNLGIIIMFIWKWFANDLLNACPTRHIHHPFKPFGKTYYTGKIYIPSCTLGQNRVKSHVGPWLLECRTLVLEALWILPDHPFQPHLGVIHLSRPSQAPLPPDELWNVYYAFAGMRWGDSVTVIRTACLNTELGSLTQIQPNNIIFIILGRKYTLIKPASNWWWY